MKTEPISKRVIGIGAALMLLLAAGTAISAAKGIDVDSGARSGYQAIEKIFRDWRGSTSMIAVAALCVVLAIAGRGIERR